MNSLKSIITIGVLALTCSFFSSCNTEPKAEAPPKIERATDKTGKEYTSRYICPMRCKGSGTEVKDQNCPSCEMALKENRNHAHYGHNH